MRGHRTQAGDRAVLVAAGLAMLASLALWSWLCPADPAKAATPAGSAGERVPGDAPAYLPDPRCVPVNSPADDAVHAFQPSEAHVVKVVYAHSSDSPNNFTSVNRELAEGVRDMVEYVYLESGDRKSIRFDLGTARGPDCVDIQRVSLPHPASFYDPDNVSGARAKVVADVEAVLGPQPGFRNYLVFADGVPNSFRSANTEPVPLDDSPQGAAWQTGGYFAVIFDNAFTYGIDDAMAGVGVHELWHMLGAVQTSAPHYGGGGHCTDIADLMCDQAFGGPALCAPRDYSTIRETRPLDCNGDDYFNPEPPPGSYLATHWNTYNSPFLCPIGTCVPDNVDPQTRIRGPQETEDRTPVFRLRSDESGVKFRCALDGRIPRRCEKRYVTPQLDPGRHTLEATAVDAAGNDDPTPALRPFRILERRGK